MLCATCKHIKFDSVPSIEMCQPEGQHATVHYERFHMCSMKYGIENRMMFFHGMDGPS